MRPSGFVTHWLQLVQSGTKLRGASRGLWEGEA
jgi:hypothetical protein